MLLSLVAHHGVAASSDNVKRMITGEIKAMYVNAAYQGRRYVRSCQREESLGRKEEYLKGVAFMTGEVDRQPQSA